MSPRSHKPIQLLVLSELLPVCASSCRGLCGALGCPRSSCFKEMVSAISREAVQQTPDPPWHCMPWRESAPLRGLTPCPLSPTDAHSPCPPRTPMPPLSCPLSPTGAHAPCPLSPVGALLEARTADLTFHSCAVRLCVRVGVSPSKRRGWGGPCPRCPSACSVQGSRRWTPAAGSCSVLSSAGPPGHPSPCTLSHLC